MHKKLQDIATISSGYSFRTSLENQENGDFSVVQARNVGTNADIIDASNLASISPKSIRTPYFLEYNDILLVARGSGPGSFRSTLFSSESKNVIASSSVHIIRITDVTVLPKYVSLYLNSEKGQKSLLEIVTGGSYIQSILIKNVADLEIPIPPVHTQKSIIALYENIINQERIFKRKQEIQRTIINASITNLTKN